MDIGYVWSVIFTFQIPTVTKDPVIKSVVEGMNKLHPTSENFYRILVRQFLSNIDMNSWEVLKLALLEFVGMSLFASYLSLFSIIK